MSVSIRLKRMGRRNRPYFRITVADSRNKRDGRSIEVIGHYDPLAEDDEKYELKTDRAAHWLSKGAVPSDTVKSIFETFGVEIPDYLRYSKSKRQRMKKKAKAKAKE